MPVPTDTYRHRFVLRPLPDNPDASALWCVRHQSWACKDERILTPDSPVQRGRVSLRDPRVLIPCAIVALGVIIVLLRLSIG